MFLNWGRKHAKKRCLRLLGLPDRSHERRRRCDDLPLSEPSKYHFDWRPKHIRDNPTKPSTILSTIWLKYFMQIFNAIKFFFMFIDADEARGKEREIDTRKRKK